MRHDPASGAILIMLRSLKMHDMAQAVAELTEQASAAFEATVPILSQLLKAEMAEREVKAVAYQLKAARFPVYRDPASTSPAARSTKPSCASSIETSSWATQGLIHKPYMKAGHFSAKIPGRISAEINNESIERLLLERDDAFDLFRHGDGAVELAVP